MDRQDHADKFQGKLCDGAGNARAASKSRRRGFGGKYLIHRRHLWNWQQRGILRLKGRPRLDDAITRKSIGTTSPGRLNFTGLVEGEYTKTFDPTFLQWQKEHTPLGRFAIGEDVANAVYSVATSLTFSTGNIITVDGGRLLK